MATHDYVISNASGAAVRADLNNALAAIVTNNSSATAPTTTYAYQWWADTGSSPAVMKLRNAANSAWITLFQLDGEWSTLALENGTAAAPSVYFKDSGTDTGFFSPGADQVAITTGGSQRVTVSTTGVTSTLPVDVALGSVTAPTYTFTGDLNTGIWSPAADTIAFSEGGSEAMRIDSSSRLLVGTSTNTNNIRLGEKIATVATQDYAGLSVTTYSNVNNAQGSIIDLQRSRGSSDGTMTSVASGDFLGGIVFRGSDGTNFNNSSLIESYVEGTPAAGKIASRLVFSTTADGASSPTERMVIKNNGYIGIGVSNPTITYSDDTGVQLYGAGSYKGTGLFNASGVPCLFINRKANDGTLIEFAQDGTTEGTISVSGTTVSYNGAHLSRWSQILGIDPHDKTDRPEILRGTVMSNLDEMCDWIDPESGNAQDNEQLNKTKISDVEGDKNVAGVFQAWDDDDDTWVNDYYLAMTGDFVIRIAAGVTVERGDLLMSAGDGTAKPQDDDIIRSKTIAKVTSTTVSCTYDDGSYCVPCVLMAC